MRFSGENFDLFFKQHPAPMLLTDVDSLYITAVNDVFTQIFGFSEKDLISQSILSLHPVAELELLSKSKTKKESPYTDHKQIWHFLIADGTVVPVQIYAKTMREDNHSFLMLAVSIIQNQEIFDYQEKIDEILINNVPDLIFRLDKNGTYLNVRASKEDELFVPKEDFLGKTIHEILPPDAAKQAFECLQKTLKTQQLISYEYALEIAGEMRYFENRMVPINREEVLSIIRDVTQQKQTEKQLADSEMRWKFALEGNGDGLWDWNLTTNKVFFSAQWRKMLGFDPTDAIDDLSVWEKLIIEEDKQLVMDLVQQAIDGRAPLYDAEYRIRTLQGEIIWIHDRGKVIATDTDGNATRMIGTHSNISDRKRAEYDLNKKTSELEQFFNLSLNLLAIIDLEGRFLKINRSWEKVLELQSDKIEGQPFTSFIHPSDFDLAVSDFQSVLKNEIVQKSTNRVVSASGEVRYIEWQVSKHEKLIYTAASDVTDKVLARQSLLDVNRRLSEKSRMLQAILDLIPVRIFWKDKNFKYQGANKRFLKDAGLKDLKELIGKSDFELNWKKFAKIYQSDDEKVIQSKKSILNFEEQQNTPDGKTIWLHTSKVPMRDEKGNITGVLGTYEDITNRKAAEDAVQKNEKFLKKLLGILNQGLLMLDNIQLLQLIANETTKLFEADFCVVTQWDEKLQAATPIISYHEMPDIILKVEETGSLSFTESLMKEEQIIMVEDTSQSEYFCAGLTSECPAKSLLGIPVIANNQKIGGIILGYSNQRIFSISEVERANLAAGILSLIIGRNNVFSELQQSEENLRLLIEKSPLGISVVDNQGKYIMCNSEFERMFGYSSEKLKQMHVLDLTDKESRQIGQHHFEKLNDKEAYSSNLYLKRADGSRFWCDLHAVRVNENLLMGFHIDISESVESKRALAHEKALLTNLLQSIPDIVFYKDLQGKYLGFNPHFEQISGRKANEIIGKTDFDIFDKATATAYRKMDQRIVNELSPIVYKETATYCNQPNVPFETQKAPLFDSNGKVMGILGLSRNITERIAYEKALETSDQLLKKLTTNVPGVIFQLQRFPDGEFEFLYVSSGFETVFETPISEIKQNPRVIFELIHEQDLEATIQLIRDSFDKLEPLNLEFRTKPKGNSSKLLRTTALPTKEKDNSVIWYGYVMDISRQFEIEKQLDEQEELLKAIFRSLEEVIYAANVKTGNIEFLSPSCLQLFGYSASELTQNKNLQQQAIHPDDLQLFLEAKTKLYQEGKGSAEYRIISKDGITKWIIDKAQIIYNDEGEPLRIEGIISEITDRKNIELALAESEQRFDLAMRYTGAGLWDWDMISNKVFYTDTWKSMLGFAHYEIGDSMEEWRSRWHPEDKPLIEKSLDNYLNKKTKRYVIEHRLKNKQGEWQWILTQGVLFRDKFDAPVRWLGTNIDITERKKLENDLKYRSELQHILMTMANRLINIDTSDIEDTVNHALEKVGQFVDADRSYIFAYDFKANTTSNTYEWCAEGISAEIDNLQDVPLDAIPDWVNTHRAGKSLTVEDVMALDEEDAIRQILEPQSVQSLIVVPMLERDELIGFIGFDAVRLKKVWTETEKELLLFMAELIVNAQTRQHYTDALEEQKNMLSMATEASNTAIYTWDILADQVKYNHQMAVILGFKNQELSSKPEYYFNSVHQDDQSKINEIVKKAISGKMRVFELEYRIRHKNGSYIWIQDKGSIVEIGRNGVPTKLSGTRINITPRKQIELALQESEERFRDLYKNAAIGLYRTTPQGKIIMVNPAMVEMLGYKNEQELLKLHLKKHKEQIAPERDDFLRSIEKSSELKGFETRWKRKDGQLIYVRENAIAIKDENGNTKYFDGSVEDITKRKQALFALEESEAKFRQLAENVDDIIWLRDMETNKVIYVNPAISKVTGHPSNVMTSKADVITEIMHPDDTESVRIGYQQFLSDNNDNWTQIFRYYHKNGQLRWMRARMQALYDTEGKKTRLIGVGTDITEHKQVEDQLKKNLELERELGQLKTRFVSMASHELRTPTATIMATTETLLAYYDKMNAEQLQKRLTKILDQSVHLKSLMDGVLDFTRLQKGKMAANMQQGDLIPLIVEIIDEFKSHPDFSHQMEFVSKLEILQWHFDANLMRQILDNLISNAAKYSPAGSKIIIKLEKQHHQIKLSVTDQGIGIPKADLKHLNEPFFRASNVGERKGTGLGMAIIKESVELHNGTIEIKSKLNKGTRITCIFPL